MMDQTKPCNTSGRHPPGTAKTVAALGDSSQLSFESTIVGARKRTEDHYEPGTLLRIKGERGIFEYRCASISRSGLVSLHLVGDHGFKAVRPEQVTVAKKGRDPQRRADRAC